MSYVVAVDVGGTGIKSALVDSDLTIIDTLNVSTPQNDPSGNAVASAIEAIVDHFKARGAISAVGLAVPGALDERAGISRWTGNLGWKNVPIVSLVQEKIGIPVAFKHDVRAGAVAEMRRGTLSGISHGIFLPIGTGIAAAFILDGEIRAADGYAGEVGHINVGSNRACVCGKSGCLEATSSTRAIAKAYRERSGQEKTTEEIVSLIDSDSIAGEVWDEAIVGLVNGCMYMITMIAPEVITLGGGLAQSGNLLVDALNRGLDSQLTFQRRPEIRLAHYGMRAGSIGCALIALDLVHE